jgi:hypothetical protein
MSSLSMIRMAVDLRVGRLSSELIIFPESAMSALQSEAGINDSSQTSAGASSAFMADVSNDDPDGGKGQA